MCDKKVNEVVEISSKYTNFTKQGNRESAINKVKELEKIKEQQNKATKKE